MADFVTPKELKRFCPELGSLQRLQGVPDLCPRRAAGMLGHPFDQQGQHADPDMGLDALRCPVKDGRQLDLGGLEQPEAALDHHQPLVPVGGGEINRDENHITDLHTHGDSNGHFSGGRSFSLDTREVD